MSNTTFAVSPDVQPKKPLEKVDYVGKLRTALRRPIEATWLPRNPLIACDEEHALLSAIRSCPSAPFTGRDLDYARARVCSACKPARRTTQASFCQSQWQRE